MVEIGSAKSLRVKPVGFYREFDFVAEVNVKGVEKSPPRCGGKTHGSAVGFLGCCKSF